MSKNPVFGYLFGKKKPARLGAGVGVKKWSDCGLKSVVYFVADIFLLATMLRNLCNFIDFINHVIPCCKYDKHIIKATGF